MTAPGKPRVVLSPFANERIREWPRSHFSRLIELQLQDGLQTIVVGTAAQRSRANYLVRRFPAPDVINACGTMTWAALVATVQSAAFVVSNNSGVAHLSASLEKWTLCLFAGSHSWIEWMPRGSRVITISAKPPCAPCELGPDLCPNDIACMVQLKADAAYAAFRKRIRAGGEWS